MNINIKRLLREALEKRLPDTTDSQELNQYQYPSLSQPPKTGMINRLYFKINKAAQKANDFMSTNPDNNYFNSPVDGDGFYQVELNYKGEIKTKHIKASADMEQRGGAFRPSDVGTCKDYQNIARYCFVKAGKNGTSVGASPAEDAANKVLIIFRNELIDFLGGSSYDDGKGAEISREKMSDKQASHKQKKDLETKIGRRLSDSEWMAFLETGQEPKPKSSITTNPDANSEFEKRQAMAIARRDAALKNRR
jgi:hypothetical protein